MDSRAITRPPSADSPLRSPWSLARRRQRSRRRSAPAVSSRMMLAGSPSSWNRTSARGRERVHPAHLGVTAVSDGDADARGRVKDEVVGERCRMDDALGREQPEQQPPGRFRVALGDRSERERRAGVRDRLGVRRLVGLVLRGRGLLAQARPGCVEAIRLEVAVARRLGRTRLGGRLWRRLSGHLGRRRHLRRVAEREVRPPHPFDLVAQLVERRERACGAGLLLVELVAEPLAHRLGGGPCLALALGVRPEIGELTAQRARASRRGPAAAVRVARRIRTATSSRSRTDHTGRAGSRSGADAAAATSAPAILAACACPHSAAYRLARRRERGRTGAGGGEGGGEGGGLARRAAAA